MLFRSVALAWFWADAAGAPFACVVGTWVTAVTGMGQFDVLFVLILAITLVSSNLDTARDAMSVLLLRPPAPDLHVAIKKALREASVVEGTRDCQRAQFWTLRDGHVVGTVKFAIAASADEQRVRRDVRRILSRVVASLTVELERLAPVLPPMVGVAGAYSVPAVHPHHIVAAPPQSTHPHGRGEVSLHHHGFHSAPPPLAALAPLGVAAFGGTTAFPPPPSASAARSTTTASFPPPAGALPAGGMPPPPPIMGAPSAFPPMPGLPPPPMHAPPMHAPPMPPSAPPVAPPQHDV